MKRLLQHPIAQTAFAKVLGLYLAFALRTTRWSLDGREHMTSHAAGAPVIVAFWHERLPMMPMLWLKARRSPDGRNARNRVHVLVSQHRDGRFIGAVVSRFALNVVLGSSTRGGAKSLRLLLPSSLARRLRRAASSESHGPTNRCCWCAIHCCLPERRKRRPFAPPPSIRRTASLPGLSPSNSLRCSRTLPPISILPPP